MNRSIYPSESAIQIAIVEWARITKMPGGKHKIGDFILAIPNGGNRSISEAVRLKKEGVKAGVSDLFFAHPNLWGYRGFWIEVKANKGKITKLQERWITLMSRTGYKAVCVYSVDEGIQAIKDYLGMK